MAWNNSDEPNEPQKPKDPWGKKKRPDTSEVEEAMEQLKQQFSSFFGGGSFSPGLIIAALVIGLVIWVLSGVYKVDEAARGVEFTFGKYSGVTGPGLHIRFPPPPITTVSIVQKEKLADYSSRKVMLTADENIVDIDLTVQYFRTDPKKYLLSISDPDATLGELAENAIREVVGKNTMDYVLKEGRADVAVQTKLLIQSGLDSYDAGIDVFAVNLVDANFPAPVQNAVLDAIKAREDKEAAELKAQAYANNVVPRARGNRERQLEEAKAYKSKRVADAIGEAERFVALLKEYELAPAVTRKRLYLEAIEEVYSNTSKVIIDPQASDNFLYLPLDQIMKNQSNSNMEAPVNQDYRPPDSADVNNNAAARQRSTRGGTR